MLITVSHIKNNSIIFVLTKRIVVGIHVFVGRPFIRTYDKIYLHNCIKCILYRGDFSDYLGYRAAIARYHANVQQIVKIINGFIYLHENERTQNHKTYIT